MTPEAKVKKKIRAMLEDAGAYYSMPVSGGFGNSGTPDFLICHHGRFIAVEAKANGNRPTALQLSAMKKIELAGGVACVIDETNLNELKDILERISYEEAK